VEGRSSSSIAYSFISASVGVGGCNVSLGSVFISSLVSRGVVCIIFFIYLVGILLSVLSSSSTLEVIVVMSLIPVPNVSFGNYINTIASAPLYPLPSFCVVIT
jgi:hypothetical protein